MPTIKVTRLSGEESDITVETDQSLMEAIRDADIDELLAICGGCLSCATCHVYVENPQAHNIEAMSDDESDLLEGSEHRKDSSRLSCQIPVTDDLDGLRIEIAPED